jgi:hypothetical protein
VRDSPGGRLNAAAGTNLHEDPWENGPYFEFVEPKAIGDLLLTSPLS